jgi:hypothetical protein
MWTTGGYDILKAAAERISTFHPALFIAYTRKVGVMSNHNGMLVTPTYANHLDLEKAVADARSIFEKVAPGYIFYPPKPIPKEEE